MSKVKAVAFAFFSPDGLRIILKSKNYRVYMHTSADELPVLKDEARNLVIVPNIDRLDDLLPLADKIHRVVVLARGKHEAVIQRGIPMVDSIIGDDAIEMVPVRTAERYCQAVEEEAVEIELTTERAKPFQPRPVIPPTPAANESDEGTPQTLTQYVDHLAEIWETVVDLDFDQSLVEPAALYCVGELSNDDIKIVLRKLIKHGLDKDEAKNFYAWLKEYLGLVLDAAREAVGGESTMMNIAKRYEVPVGDLQLIADVYKNQSANAQ